MSAMPQTEGDGGPSVQRSFRISADVLRLLDARADELGVSRNALAQRVLGEGLRTDRHPLIAFREGGSGRRRPALAGHRLYVWQIIRAAQRNDRSIEKTAEHLGLSPHQVRAAVEYYADFKDEIDEEARAAEAAEQIELERWERAQNALR